MANTICPKEVEIIKGEADKCEYRYVELKNGLVGVAVSDTAAEFAAVSLTVGSGWVNDPKDKLGLSHFLEHLLFMGTEEYQDESEYFTFVSENGGVANAFTQETKTTYMFMVRSDKLELLFDRFSRFFISPLLKKECVEKEINAVHSEYELRYNNDVWRRYAVAYHLSKKEHPFRSFGVGNNITLSGTDTRDSVVDLYKRCYSSHIMKVAVYGNQSLEYLSDLIGQKLSDVPRLDKVYSVEDPGDRYDESLFGKLVWIKAATTTRDLVICFELENLRKYYKKAPIAYLSYVVGHEGEGSLSQYLKSKGLIVSLYGLISDRVLDHESITISISLTSEGLHRCKDVTNVVFSYLEKLCKLLPQKWIYDEFASAQKIKFDNPSSDAPITKVVQISTSLLEYNPQDVLSADVLVEEFDPDLILSVLKKLSRKNAIVYVVQNYIEKEYNETETYFHIPYLVENHPLDSAFQDEEFFKESSALSLPSRNKLIPTDFSIKGTKAEKPASPVSIINKDGIQIWHKLDDTFMSPKAMAGLWMRKPYMLASAQNMACTELYVRILSCHFLTLFDNLRKTGFRVSIRMTYKGIVIGAEWYNHHLLEAMDQLVSAFYTHEVSASQFEVQKDEYIRSLREIDKMEPLNQASREITNQTMLISYHHHAKIDSIEKVGYEDMKVFLDKLRISLEVDALVHGNLTDVEAKGLFGLVSRYNHTVSDCKFSNRTVCLEGSKLVELKNDNIITNAVMVYMQLGLAKDDHLMALCFLMMNIMQNHFFNTLRTKEQLGYSCSAMMHDDYFGAICSIQSSTDANEVQKRIESFLDDFPAHIEAMQDSEIAANIQAVHFLLSNQKHLSLLFEYQEYFGCITYGRDFEQSRRMAELVLSLNKEALTRFSRKVLENPPRVIVHVCKTANQQEKRV